MTPGGATPVASLGKGMMPMLIARSLERSRTSSKETTAVAVRRAACARRQNW
jgi:hypothetical protein